MPDQIVTFELRLSAFDQPTTRRRWNEKPFPSEEAAAALFDAVEAFQAAIRAHGFETIHTGYGVSAKESD